MLESLRIRNFQKHAKLDVTFGPGVTVILGPTDSGKSAVIRALGLVSRNKPSGNAFIREGKKRASVTLVVDGQEVKRTRGKGANSYKLGDRELKAFGASVPGEVAKQLSISDINFQSQHDAAYWFGESKPAVAKQLNAIVDLSLVDSSLHHAATRARNAETDVRLLGDQLRCAQEDLAELAWVRKAEKAWAEVEALSDRVNEAHSKTDALYGVWEQAHCSRQAAKRSQFLANALADVVAAGASLEPLRKQHAALSRILTNLKEQEGLTKRRCDFSEVKKAFAALAAKMQEFKALRSILVSIKTADEDRKVAASNAAGDHRKFAEVSQGQCPLCGAKHK